MATRLHYWNHLLPVWEALPPEHRGTLYVGGRLVGSAQAQEAGAVPKNMVTLGPGPRMLVASQMDYQQVAPRRRVIHMQHGSGQSYGGDPDPAVNRASSYAGGDGQDRTDLFLVPGPHPAQRCKPRYPHIPVAEIGCPALDRWIGYERPMNRRAVVALAWHWDNPLCPETRSALPHFREALTDLTRTYAVLGHAHPRARDMVAPVYEALGIPWVGYETVMELADVLVCDNTSIGWEFLTTSRPTVWLTPPWYRPIDHGIRFGGDIGMEVREPRYLLTIVDHALSGLGAKPDLSRVYTYLDGRSAERAAAAIVALDDKETAMAGVV